MDDLPYIDEHRLRIEAPRDDVWRALISVLARFDRAVPGPIARLWGLAPADLRGEWRGGPGPGDSLPGFEVADSRESEHLALRGRHHFSRYALVFDLDPLDANACTLRASSWAEFPGLHGRGYRALVIGTGGHRVAVRHLLRSVRHACR
jgi:hypothetical protein